MAGFIIESKTIYSVYMPCFTTSFTFIEKRPANLVLNEKMQYTIKVRLILKENQQQKGMGQHEVFG